MLEIITKDKKKHKVQEGTTILDFFNSLEKHEFKPLVALYNNRIVSLNTEITEKGTLIPLGINTSEGMEAYRKSASMLLSKAFLDVFRNGRIVIGQSLGNNYYFDVSVDIPVDNEVLDLIKGRMKQLIKSDKQFCQVEMNRTEAIDIFIKQGLNDKVRLLKNDTRKMVKLQRCGKYYDLYFGPLLPSTSFIDLFELRKYQSGMVLSFPDQLDPTRLAPLKHYRKLFNIYKESKKWQSAIKINNVGRLNEFIRNNKIHDYIKTAEVFHERKIAQIADMITADKNNIRIVLIAGPSSSGKTTFSKRLAVHLHVNGIDSVPISLDNYFLNREKTPKDEDGDYDFESIYALDLDLFNEHLVKLTKGDEVEIPNFDFESGSRKGNGYPLRIAENQIIIIEGIHGLNDLLTHSIAKENKFKIYISALTQIAFDDFNRIHTTDTRLIRRIVRDQKFRGYSATDNLNRWASVRRGEEKNIFPYQENADVMFNSAVVYELAVLKRYAEPLLKKVSPDKKVYSIAQNLLELLDKFHPLEDESGIPPTSILREFIGNSSFNY